MKTVSSGFSGPKTKKIPRADRGIADTKQIRDIDRSAIISAGIPSAVLMENAGSSVAKVVASILRRMAATRVCVVCGTGNNGGDGLVCARYLLEAGLRPRTFLVGAPADLKSDAAVNYRILKNLNENVFTLGRVTTNFLRAASTSRVVVDAIFGFGLNRDVGDPHRGIMAVINEKSRYTVSVDIPSGLDATTGKIWGCAVKADTTVTFTCAKRGLLCGEGPHWAGRVIVADIGVPAQVVRRVLSPRQRPTIR